MNRAVAARKSLVRREVATVVVEGCAGYLWRHGLCGGGATGRCTTVNAAGSLEHDDAMSGVNVNVTFRDPAVDDPHSNLHGVAAVGPKRAWRILIPPETRNCNNLDTLNLAVIHAEHLLFNLPLLLA